MVRTPVQALLVAALIGGGELSRAQQAAGPPAAPPNVAPSRNICLPDTGSLGWCGDGGPASKAKLARPMDVAAGADGSLVVADTENQVIRRIAPDGRIATIAGYGIRGDARSRVPARRATFRGPSGVAIDADGSVLVVDSGNGALRRIDLLGVVTVLTRRLSQPSDVVVLPDGSYAVAEPGRHRIVGVGADGAIRPLAGTGRPGYGGDGAAARGARLRSPMALASSADGLLIADTGNAVVRRIGLDGTIATVAGAPPGPPVAGPPALQLALAAPDGVAAKSDGGLVIGDSGRLWEVAPDGTVRPLAGTDQPGFNGDGAVALSTRLAARVRPTTAPSGEILVADTRNDRIRSVAPAGAIATVAGSDRPDVTLAPVAAAPFLRPPEPWRDGKPRFSSPLSPFQLRGKYRFAAGGGPVRKREPPCSKSTARMNVLKFRPYSQIPLRAAARPVVFSVGTSIDVRLTGYAWRAGRKFGLVHKRAPAGVRRLRLRGRLNPGSYLAVIIGVGADDTRGCDARRLRVG